MPSLLIRWENKANTILMSLVGKYVHDENNFKIIFNRHYLRWDHNVNLLISTGILSALIHYLELHYQGHTGYGYHLTP